MHPFVRPHAHVADQGGEIAVRVLVVDDHIDAADTLKMVLTLKGYDAESAHSGESALAAASEFAPDVVLLDLGMPEMNGLQVAERLRGTDIALVALTGYGQEEDRKRTEEAGFAHHLVKPVDPDVLLTLLENIRSSRHAKSD